MKRLFCWLLVGMAVMLSLKAIRSAPAPAPRRHTVVTRDETGARVAYHYAEGDDAAVIETEPGRPPLLAQATPGFPPPRGDYGHPAPRESARDIPVPIVPGSRVTDAEIEPPRMPTRPMHGPRRRPQPQHLPAATGVPPETRTIAGRLSATPDRARADARQLLDRAIAEWLQPEVPTSWHVPPHLADALVRDTQVKPVEKDLGTMYEASIRADFSPDRRSALVASYQRALMMRRLATLGGIFAFVLTCLAALAGYIRADEATKGYYTNRIRLATVVSVAAVGAIVFRLLA